MSLPTRKRIVLTGTPIQVRTIHIGLLCENYLLFAVGNFFLVERPTGVFFYHRILQPRDAWYVLKNCNVYVCCLADRLLTLHTLYTLVTFEDSIRNSEVLNGIHVKCDFLNERG